MLLSMGAVFALVFWNLFLVMNVSTGRKYNKYLGALHFIYVISWWSI
jgi:hypothetical protein